MDAINWTNRNAEFAASALTFDHGVHEFVSADDGIRRTGIDAQRATYTPIFVDPSQLPGAFSAVVGVQFNNGLPSQLGQPSNAFLTAGGTEIDGRFFCGDSSRVRSTIRIATPRTLRLRQNLENGFDGYHWVAGVFLRLGATTDLAWFTRRAGALAVEEATW